MYKTKTRKKFSKLINLTKNWVASLNYESHREIETRNNIDVNVFRYSNRQFYMIYLSKKNLENYMELLMLENESKSQGDKLHYVYIKNSHQTIKKLKKNCMSC